jgi:hypothetical protein
VGVCIDRIGEQILQRGAADVAPFELIAHPCVGSFIPRHSTRGASARRFENRRLRENPAIEVASCY